MNLNRELSRIQAAYQQIQNNPGAQGHETIKRLYEKGMIVMINNADSALKIAFVGVLNLRTSQI